MLSPGARVNVFSTEKFGFTKGFFRFSLYIIIQPKNFIKRFADIFQIVCFLRRFVVQWLRKKIHRRNNHYAFGNIDRNVQKSVRGRLRDRRVQREQHGNHSGYRGSGKRMQFPPDLAGFRRCKKVRQPRLPQTPHRGGCGNDRPAHRDAPRPRRRLRGVQICHRRRVHFRHDRRVAPRLCRKHRDHQKGRAVCA